MRTAIGITACTLVTLTLHLITPFWWWVMIIPLLFGVIRARSCREGFITGSASAGIIWLCGCLAAYKLGGGIVAGRVADLLMVGEPWILLAATSFAAALLGGIGGGTGYHLGRAFSPGPDRKSHG